MSGSGSGPTDCTRRSAITAIVGAAAVPTVSRAVASPDGVSLPRGDGCNTGHVSVPGPSGRLGIDWSHQFDTRVTTTPTPSNDSVYVGTSDGSLHALASGSGSRQWMTDLDAVPFLTISATRDRLYVPTRDGHISALEQADGTRDWHSRVGDGVHSPVTTDGSIVVAGGRNGSVTVLDAATGDQRWRETLPEPVRTVPALTGEYVVARDEGGAVAVLDQSTGEQLWRRDAEYASPAAAFDGPAIRDGRVYVGFKTSDGTRLTALDLADGSIQWERDVPGSVFQLVATADRLIAFYGDAVHGHDPTDGTRLWRIEQTTLVRLASATDVLYVLSDEAIGVYDLEDGTGERFVPGSGPLDSLLGRELRFGGGPVPAPGGVLISNGKAGTVWRLRGSTGPPRLDFPSIVAGAGVLGIGAYALARWRSTGDR